MPSAEHGRWSCSRGTPSSRPCAICPAGKSARRSCLRYGTPTCRGGDRHRDGDQPRARSKSYGPRPACPPCAGPRAGVIGGHGHGRGTGALARLSGDLRRALHAAADQVEPSRRPGANSRENPGRARPARRICEHGAGHRHLVGGTHAGTGEGTGAQRRRLLRRWPNAVRISVPGRVRYKQIRPRFA